MGCSNNTTNIIGVLYIDDSNVNTVPGGGTLPLSRNTIRIPNNGIAVNLSDNTIRFLPGIYNLSFTIVARIPICDLSTIPLSITQNICGRNDLTVIQSAYNTSNIATLNGNIMLNGRACRCNGIKYINTTMNDNGDYVPIEILRTIVAAFRVL